MASLKIKKHNKEPSGGPGRPPLPQCCQYPETLSTWEHRPLWPEDQAGNLHTPSCPPLQISQSHIQPCSCFFSLIPPPGDSAIPHSRHSFPQPCGPFQHNPPISGHF